MKIKLVLLAAFVPFAANAATTITPSNGTTTGTILQVIDNSGVPVAGGSVLIGTFADPSVIATADAGDVLTGFTQFGTPQSFSPVAGLFGFANSFGVTADLPNEGAAAGDLVGNNIFAVIQGDGDFIIWDSGQQFAFESALDAGLPVSFNVTEQGTLVRGVLVTGGNTGLPGALSPQNGGTAVTFGLVPEPSSALLAGLALFGGLVRRRR